MILYRHVDYDPCANELYELKGYRWEYVAGFDDVWAILKDTTPVGAEEAPIHLNHPGDTTYHYYVQEV